MAAEAFIGTSGWNNIVVCQSDAADWPMWDAVTIDLVYVRLHGHDATYHPADPRDLFGSADTKRDHPEIGDDLKVLGLRSGEGAQR